MSKISQNGFATPQILIFVFILALAVVVGGYFAFGPKAQAPEQNQNQQLVGSDRDEHGCIGSAGYSWCGVKSKCLRTWEETCVTVATSTILGNAGTPRIIDYFACSDYCPGPRESYMIKIYEGVTDEAICKGLGGAIYTYYGWGKFTVCKAQ